MLYREIKGKITLTKREREREREREQLTELFPMMVGGKVMVRVLVTSGHSRLAITGMVCLWS